MITTIIKKLSNKNTDKWFKIEESCLSNLWNCNHISNLQIILISYRQPTVSIDHNIIVFSKVI